MGLTGFFKGAVIGAVIGLFLILITGGIMSFILWQNAFLKFNVFAIRAIIIFPTLIVAVLGLFGED
jgi:cytochrome b subunit of formate dehydrogenase